MINVKKLLGLLQMIPDVKFCYGYEGEVQGIVFVNTKGDEVLFVDNNGDATTTPHNLLEM